MNNIQAEYIKADELLKQFVEKEDKFNDRYASLITDMNRFIEINNLKDKVKVNCLSLGYALVDYFEDVRRLKLFHNIEHINSEKIVAYTAYWLLQRKPLQLLVEDKELLYVNELFVMSYIVEFISVEDKKSLFLRTEQGLKGFKDTLLYFLKYRITSANMIELAILSFFAGRIYQSDDVDLSATFDKYSGKNK